MFFIRCRKIENKLGILTIFEMGYNYGATLPSPIVASASVGTKNMILITNMNWIPDYFFDLELELE